MQIVKIKISDFFKNSLRLILFLPFQVLFGFVEADGAQESASNVLYIDRMDNPLLNELKGMNNSYRKRPSGAAYYKTPQYGIGKGNPGLRIDYEKKSSGWCGFYTIIKKSRDDYFDASGYEYLTLWVRGDVGGENFKIGFTDKTWASKGDSVKSESINNYLPKQKGGEEEGRITTNWQRAVLPLKEIEGVDLENMDSLSICFESDLFKDGVGRGTVYIDNLALTREYPTDTELSQIASDEGR